MKEGPERDERLRLRGVDRAPRLERVDAGRLRPRGRDLRPGTGAGRVAHCTGRTGDEPGRVVGTESRRAPRGPSAGRLSTVGLYGTPSTAMADGAGPAAIAVEGPVGDGKRTIGSYVRLLAEETGAFEPVVVDLRGKPEEDGLFKMMSNLGIALGSVFDLKTTHEEPAREATTLARDVVMAAAAAQSPTWLVANFLARASDLEPRVVPFVDELLFQVQSEPAIVRNFACSCSATSSSSSSSSTSCRSTRATLSQVSDVEIRAVAGKCGAGQAAGPVRAHNCQRALRHRPGGLSAALRLQYVSLQCGVAHRRLAALQDVRRRAWTPARSASLSCSWRSSKTALTSGVSSALPDSRLSIPDGHDEGRRRVDQISGSERRGCPR